MRKNVNCDAVKNVIREYIERERLRPGARLPSLRELVRISGASLPTVQRAVTTLVGEGMLSSRIGAGTYVAGAASSATRLIGLIMPRFDPDSLGFFPADCFAGLRDTLEANGYALLSFEPAGAQGAEREQGELELVELFNRLGVHALAVDLSSPMHSRIWKRLSELSFPVVCFNNHDGEHTFSTVSLDNRLGGRLVAEHFLKRGHRRVAVITGNNNATSSVRERIAGFRDAMEAGGGAFSETDLFALSVAGNFPAAFERAGFPGALEPYTGIFCINDGIAVHLMTYLRRNGVPVPGRFSIAGFDDSLLCEHVQPRLTSVSQGNRRMGECAAQLLLEQLNALSGVPAADIRQIWLKPQLVERDSILSIQG